MICRYVKFISAIIASGCLSTLINNDLYAHINKYTRNYKKIKESGNVINSFIVTIEKEVGIPGGLLTAIAEVESKKKPYVVNTKNGSHDFSSKDNAIKFVNKSLVNGHKNISIGCCQLHYNSHKSKFSSISDMFDLKKNVSYAAKLLKNLYEKHGNWKTAIERYHSTNSNKAQIYYDKVINELGYEL